MQEKGVVTRLFLNMARLTDKNSKRHQTFILLISKINITARVHHDPAVALQKPAQTCSKQSDFLPFI